MFDRFDRPRVVVVERPWPPLAEVWVQLPVGSLADPDGVEGLSYLAWQTAIEAGGKRNSTAYARALDVIGATLDVDVGLRRTIVHGQVPTLHIKKFMSLLSDVVLRPQFDADDFKRKRKLAIADAHASMDDDEVLADDAAMRYLHRGEPVGRSAEGTAKSLKKVTLSAAKKLHARAIRTAMRFGFAGDLRRQPALELVDRYFPDSEGSKKPLTNRKTQPPKLAGRRLLVLNRPGRTQAQIVILVPTVGANSAKMPAMAIAATALGGTFTSRLVRQVRELRGWSYSLDADLEIGYDTGVIAIRWAPQNRVTAASIDLVMGQLELLRATGLTKPELRFIKDHLKGAHRLAIETAAGEMAERMRALALGLPIDYPQRLSALIGRVDRKFLSAALVQHFDPSRAVAVVVGDAAVLSTSLAKMTSGFAVETIAYTASPEATTVVGNLVSVTKLAKPPPPPDPNASAETGPIFDESGDPVDEAQLPEGDTSTDDDDALDDGAVDEDADAPPDDPPPTIRRG